MKVKLLIFSDLHLGAYQSTATVEKIKKAIDKHKPEKVIFNGDTLDLYVDKNSERYLEELKDLGIFLSGNHDPIFNWEFYETKIAGRDIIIFHGHQKDGVTWFPWLGKVAAIISDRFHRWTGFNLQDFFRGVFDKKYDYGLNLPLFHQQRKDIIETYHDYGIIIIGHTHYPEHTFIEGVQLINLGDWSIYGLVYDDATVKMESLDDN